MTGFNLFKAVIVKIRNELVPCKTAKLKQARGYKDGYKMPES